MKRDRKRHTSVEVVAKLNVAIALEEGGFSQHQAAQEIGVGRTTYYRWRMKFSGMNPQQVQCVLDLEDENVRLRRALLEMEPEGLTRGSRH